MTWSGQEPARWPVQAGVVVLEGEPGDARAAAVSRWVAQHGEGGGPVRRLQCSHEVGGVWAGLRSLFEGLIPTIRDRAPALLARHARELCLIVPELGSELTFSESMMDSAGDKGSFRQAAADRADRSLHGLIDLLDEWHQLELLGPWAIACESFDSTSDLVRRFFVELVRRRGSTLGLRLLLVVEPGRGEDVAAAFEGNSIAVTVRLPLSGGAPATPSPALMTDLARELEAQLVDVPEPSELQLLRVADAWRRSTTPERGLGRQLQMMEYYNRAALYEASLPYAREVEAGLDDIYRLDPELYLVAIEGLFVCYSALNRGDAMLPVLRLALSRVVVGRATAMCSYLLAMLHTRFVRPPDFPAAEAYLLEGLAALMDGEATDDDRHFLTAYLMNGLALVRMRQGRLVEAIDLCQEAIERLDTHFGPQSRPMFRSILIYNIAQVQAARDAYAEAIEYYSQAIALDPGYCEYYNDRGSLFLRMGCFEEAERDYLQAIALTAPCPEIWTNLGQCHRATGRMEEAAMAYSRALDLNPALNLALVGRADANCALERADLALADYDAAIAMEPDQPLVLANRAIVHYQSGRLPEALADLDGAVALAPEVGELYQNRAIALQDMGRDEEAVRDLRKYLELCPHSDDREEVAHQLSALVRTP